jgi:hypothetical protein
MARALERRLAKLEKAAGGLPCKKPGHDDLFLFIKKYHEDEINAQEQARIDSIRACDRCKDKLVVVMMLYGRETPEQVIEQRANEPKALDFIFGEESRIDGTRTEPSNPAPTVSAPDWLRDLITIGED